MDWTSLYVSFFHYYLAPASFLFYKGWAVLHHPWKAFKAWRFLRSYNMHLLFYWLVLTAYLCTCLIHSLYFECKTVFFSFLTFWKLFPRVIHVGSGSVCTGMCVTWGGWYYLLWEKNTTLWKVIYVAQDHTVSPRTRIRTFKDAIKIEKFSEN